jgi:hypothetical protein
MVRRRDLKPEVCGHDPVASCRAGASALSRSAASIRILSSGLTAAATAARMASTVENPAARRALAGLCCVESAAVDEPTPSRGRAEVTVPTGPKPGR